MTFELMSDYSELKGWIVLTAEGFNKDAEWFSQISLWRDHIPHRLLDNSEKQTVLPHWREVKTALLLYIQMSSI